MVERGKNTNVEVAAEYCTTYPKLPSDAWEKNANCTLGAADKKEKRIRRKRKREWPSRHQPRPKEQRVIPAG